MTKHDINVPFPHPRSNKLLIPKMSLHVLPKGHTDIVFIDAVNPPKCSILLSTINVTFDFIIPWDESVLMVKPCPALQHRLPPPWPPRWISHLGSQHLFLPHQQAKGTHHLLLPRQHQQTDQTQTFLTIPSSKSSRISCRPTSSTTYPPMPPILTGKSGMGL